MAPLRTPSNLSFSEGSSSNKLVYAKEVLADRIHVYQVHGKENFAVLAATSRFITPIGNYHIFAELWVSADPATESQIGHDPALGSMRTIFTGDEGRSASGQGLKA